MSVIINAFIFLVLAAVIPGITINSIWSALGAAIVYGILSFLVEPVLKFITVPLNWLTLGLIHFLLSGLTLYMTSGLVSGFNISSFWVALFASAILGFLNSALASRKDY